MDTANVIAKAEAAFKAAHAHLSTELARLRTGRAHPGMLDGVMVEAYGTQMPLNQVGGITVPESQLLQITPFDPTNLQAIAAAIRNNQSLGLNPTDDGRVVRVQIPPLTEERRRELSKQIGEKMEDALVRMRTVRHDVLRQLETAKKEKQISEDDFHRSEKAIDEAMNNVRLQMDASAKSKENELLSI
ncbi:MAG: ribosome recycling factor [Candidatus Saccharimonadales bacterium]